MWVLPSPPAAVQTHRDGGLPVLRPHPFEPVQERYPRLRTDVATRTRVRGRPVSDAPRSVRVRRFPATSAASGRTFSGARYRHRSTGRRGIRVRRFLDPERVDGRMLEGARYRTAGRVASPLGTGASTTSRRAVRGALPPQGPAGNGSTTPSPAVTRFQQGRMPGQCADRRASRGPLKIGVQALEPGRRVHRPGGSRAISPTTHDLGPGVRPKRADRG